MVLDKPDMTEEDVKLQYITPAILAKWDCGHVTMETKITDGRINLKGNFVVRGKPKKADYVLYLEKILRKAGTTGLLRILRTSPSIWILP